MRVRAGLGTVQLGLPYGNRVAEELMPRAAAFAILTAALERGVRFFDTAPAYGDAEARLGEFRLAARAPDVEVATKIPLVPVNVWRDADAYWAAVANSVTASLRRLGLNRVGLIQFHQSDRAFLQSTHLPAVIERLHDRFCDGVGVSVYALDEARLALRLPGVTTLQVPVNLVDTRFTEPTFLSTCHAAGVHVIARSLLLQGVLVQHGPLPPVSKAPQLAELRRRLEAVRVRAGVPLETLALQWAHSALPSGSIALIGVDSVAALHANLDAFFSPLAVPRADLEDWLGPARSYASAEGLVHPGLW